MHIFENAHVAKKGVMLEYKSHLALLHFFIDGVFTRKENGSRIGFFEAGNTAQKGGFSWTGKSCIANENYNYQLT